MSSKPLDLDAPLGPAKTGPTPAMWAAFLERLTEVTVACGYPTSIDLMRELIRTSGPRPPIIDGDALLGDAKPMAFELYDEEIEALKASALAHGYVSVGELLRDVIRTKMREAPATAKPPE